MINACFLMKIRLFSKELIVWIINHVAFFINYNQYGVSSRLYFFINKSHATINKNRIYPTLMKSICLIVVCTIHNTQTRAC